jgi:transposase
VFQGELTVAEAARREKVSEQSVGNWKRQFLEAGKSKLSTRGQRLEDEVAELTTALGVTLLHAGVQRSAAQ